MNYTEFKKYLKERSPYFTNCKLAKVIQDFTFIQISTNDELLNNIEQNQFINQNIQNSKVIIIDKNDSLDEYISDKFIILCFEKTLLILKQSMISLVYTLLSNNSNLSVCFLKSMKEIFTEKIENPIIKYDLKFYEEIININDGFYLIEKTIFSQFFSCISPCMSGYLIKKSYFKLKKDRAQSFKDFVQNPFFLRNIDKDDYIELRNIGFGSLFMVVLIYHIERGELFALKKANSKDDEIPKLIKREKSNYEKIHHPFLPIFYGTVEDDESNYIIIEFINGQTLNECQFDGYDENTIIMILYELLFIIDYFHCNDFLIRDLKPNNLMITEQNEIVMIDFDRVINQSTQTHSHDLDNKYAAPEVKTKELYSKESDIYSLGKVIEFILNKLNPKIKILGIHDIKEQCLQEDADKRKSIDEIINNLSAKIQNISLKHSYKTEIISYISSALSISNYPEAQFYIGLIYYSKIYVEPDMNKAIHYFLLSANQNYPHAQYILGFIYSTGKYVNLNINKGIYYLTLAANQNYPQAPFILGLIYFSGIDIERDMNKAIYYLTLAANKNIPLAQNYLGLIYYKGEYVERDMNKAIYYLTLSANQNIPDAQNCLGLIYYTREYVERDMNKAIYYLTLAANQNIPLAQIYLGFIYYAGEYVERDINKAIYYLTLAANQNIPQAQTCLGLIYSTGEYVERDINKAIYYLTLAANKNIPLAQNNLGFIYSTGIYVERDINKAIYYLTLAANQNYPESQYYLGVLYSSVIYAKRDINKAIYYLTLAANQNIPLAQFYLGFIYYKGEYVERDINKAIYYLTLAANQNIPLAQTNLGFIYYTGEYVERDINKAIYYFSLASNQNYPEAQYHLGIIYYYGLNCKQDIYKGKQLIMLSSYYEFRLANFAHGFLLHKEKKITEAIHYYKEASSFNIQYAKNNLGIIYKHGFGDEIPKRIGDSIVYFEEAIRQKNDVLSMYNLARIHIYEETIKRDIDKSIELLIKSSTEFEPSFILLCAVLIKTFGFNIVKIKCEIEKRVDKTNNLYTELSTMINILIYMGKFYVDYIYETYRNKDFLYDVIMKPVCSSDLLKENEEQNSNMEDISEDFYEGFGYDLINTDSKS